MRRFESSPTGIFVFLFVRSVRNAAARLLKRLKEPRYAIGFSLGLLYFTWVLFGSRMTTRRSAGRALAVFSAETLSLLLFVASALLATSVLVSWLLRKGKPDLGLTEAEAQFFFPAPLSSRAVLHYALIRPQAALLVSSTIFVLVLGRGPLPDRWRPLIGTWIVLTTLRFHSLGRSFSKASWAERPARLKFLLRIVGLGVAGGLLIILATSLVDAGRLLFSSLAQKGDALPGLTRALTSRRFAGVSELVLLPFRILLEPLFAPDFRSFVLRLPFALAIAAANYLWVARTTVRYEETTLEGAARRARARASLKAGRLRAAPSRSSRHAVPFRLRAPGKRPETAIVWKNLLAWQRIRLSRFAAVALSISVSLFVLSRVLCADEQGKAIGFSIAATIALMAVMIGILLPSGGRYGLRDDLEHVDLLRVWPLSATRLVAAELAAPWILCTIYFWSGLAFSFATLAGILLGGPTQFGHTRLGLPALAATFLALAWFVPALSGVVALAHSAMLLTFPAWFRARERRVTGLETMGMRMLTLLVTLIILVVASVPSGLIAALAFLLAGKSLGLWMIPVAALFASLPLWFEVAVGVRLLSRLFEGLDPSLDLGV